MWNRARIWRKPWFATIRFVNRNHLVILMVLIAIQSTLLGWHAYRSSPVSDEYGHFYAGVQYWHHGDLHSFNVNPPLVRALGTLPAYLNWDELAHFSPSFDMTDTLKSGALSRASVRSEFPYGRELYATSPKQFQRQLFWGRLLVSLFAVAATVAVFRWSQTLYGVTPHNRSPQKLSPYGSAIGLVAAGFWAFQPQVLAHGSLITNDIAVAAAMLVSSLCFCRWIKSLHWQDAALGGATLGLALSCKFTALLLCPIYLAFVIWRYWSTRQPRIIGQASLALALTLLMIALPYGFDGVGKPLGELKFTEDALYGQTIDEIASRFENAWFGRIPCPVPEQYLDGMDRQQSDFREGIISYAAGMNTTHGWWWFYLYSMLVKLPTGTLVAIAASLLYLIGRMFDRDHRWSISLDQILIGCIAAAMIEITAYKSGFAQQHRYILPLYPFLFLLIVAPLARHHESNTSRIVNAGILVGLMATLIASIGIAPHWLGAFNTVSGGTDRGHFHLFNDATDWGQDNDLIAHWITTHPQHRPLKLISSTGLGMGIREAYPEFATLGRYNDANQKWLIVSKSDLSRNPSLLHSLPTEPTESIGASHLLFRVDH